MPLRAVIFDLDGVLTDTAEYHYQAWKRLAEEEGLAFSRADNELLRGVSRRDSLLLMLRERRVDEESMQAMMARKNSYYQEMLRQVAPADLLPGVAELLDELDAASIPYALASASRNASDVVARLGIAARLALVADGHSVSRQKPAPDLFRYAAARLNAPPGNCLVIEDAAAGIEAALAAGMHALALGPAERFNEGLVGNSHFLRYESLQGVGLVELQAAVEIDPRWTVGQSSFDPASQRHMETLFTIGNGYFASRGAFEEDYGESALTLAHGIFDDVPLFFTELVNLPNWLDFHIEVDGSRFRLDQGKVLHFQRWLDLRQAVLRREVRWQAPGGTIVDITFERFASYSRPHLGGLRVLLTAVNQPCHITFRASINGHVANDKWLHWRHLAQGQAEDGAIWLHSCCQNSEIEVGTAAVLATPDAVHLTRQECPGQPSLILRQDLIPGETLLADKLISYTATRDVVDGAAGVIGRALAQLDGQNYNTLKAEHLAAWERVWQDIDVVIEGDDEAQLALRFSLFQLQVAAPQHDDRVSIGAKTLSGLGYRGHVFWDTEIFVLPFFTYTQPQIARNLLMYRYHTLAGARRKAASNGYRGAQYAWESASTGDEVTPTWLPDFTGKGLVRIWTGDIELHITADIAYAIRQYWQVTGADAFMRDYGAEIILDTARFWADRAELEEENGQRRYAIRDVIGPDEYHDHVDNNAFTNRMAQWHLQTALAVLQWLHDNYPERATALTEQLDLTEEELQRWQDVIAYIIIPHDPETGLIIQFDNFFDLEPVDLPAYEGRSQSMQAILGIEGANKSQVIKQADVIMLLCLLRDLYDQKTWQHNWDTYMPRTDHSYGSSLGPSFHAWAACEMNQPDEAYEHFMLAARADLYDIRGNAGDGIHAASAGGLWQAVVFGFAGLHLADEGYRLAPRLPAKWQRLAFKFYQHGQQQVVDIRKSN
jgi:kojibiose phosphorylase